MTDGHRLQMDGAWGTELMSATALPVGVATKIALVRRGNTFTLYTNDEVSCVATLDSWTEHAFTITRTGFNSDDNGLEILHTIGALYGSPYHHGPGIIANPFHGTITGTKFTGF